MNSSTYSSQCNHFHFNIPFFFHHDSSSPSLVKISSTSESNVPFLSRSLLHCFFYFLPLLIVSAFSSVYSTCDSNVFFFHNSVLSYLLTLTTLKKGKINRHPFLIDHEFLRTFSSLIYFRSLT